VDLFNSYLTDDKFMQPAWDYLDNVCGMIMTESTCVGFLKLRHVIIKNLIQFDLKPEYFCEEVYKTCDTDYYVEDKYEDYVARVVADKPASIANDDFVQK